jgi:hypothetical protein
LYPRNSGNFLVEFSSLLFADRGVKGRDSDNQDGFFPADEERVTSLKSPCHSLKIRGFLSDLKGFPNQGQGIPLNVVPPLRSTVIKDSLEVNFQVRPIMTNNVWNVTRPRLEGTGDQFFDGLAIRWRDRSRPKTSNIWNRLGPLGSAGDRHTHRMINRGIFNPTLERDRLAASSVEAAVNDRERLKRDNSVL